MAVWDELKVVLARLRDQQPGALMQYPMPEVDEGRQPPFMIGLVPWAAATAEELHQQFGDDIELTVGALPYPPGRQPSRPPAADPPADLLDPHEIVAELAGPAVVSSGHTLQHGLLLRNLTGRDLQIAANGQVTAVVVDPGTGEVVGGFAGFQILPLIIFRVAPGQTGRVPAADRHGQLHAPAGLRRPARRLGNPGNAHPRPAPPRLAPQADPGPAPHRHCLNHRRAGPRDRRNRDLKLDTTLPGRPRLPCELQLRGSSSGNLHLDRTGSLVRGP